MIVDINRKDPIHVYEILDEYGIKKCWCPLYGDIRIVGIDKTHQTIFAIVDHPGSDYDEFKVLFDRDGYIFIDDNTISAECMLFYDKDHRSWNLEDIGLTQGKESVPVEKTFDFTTLGPFDAVLARLSDSGTWHADFIDYVELKVDDEGKTIPILHLNKYDCYNVEVMPYIEETSIFAGVPGIPPAGYVWKRCDFNNITA